MARWRLTQKHYLSVPGVEWEQKETNRDTGRQLVKRYPVPMFLDPDNPGDVNYDGMVVVGQGKGTMPKDYIFTGPPTPDMEPLDDEAQAITDAESPKWVHPIESLPGQGYGDALLVGLTKQLETLMAQQKPAQSLGNVTTDAFEALKKQVEDLAKQNATLQAQLASAKPAERRI